MTPLTKLSRHHWRGRTDQAGQAPYEQTDD
jgi:hypothetical protein